jgi:hypothetical protein
MKECPTPLFAELEGYKPGYLDLDLCPPDQEFGRLNIANLFPSTEEAYLRQKEGKE